MGVVQRASTRSDSGMEMLQVCTSRTHAVGCICELASNLVHQFFVVPARAIALDDVFGAVVGMGLGGGVTNPDSHLWMEWTERCGVVNSAKHTSFCRLSL